MKTLPKLPSACALALALAACAPQGEPPPEVAANAAPAVEARAPAPAPATQSRDLSTPEGKIQDAMRAAPRAIAAAATIMDWPASEGAEPTRLRAGTNGWTCFPTSPAVQARAASDPMCVDAAMLSWAQAYMAGTQPSIESVGFSYMLAGDGGASNVDPFATGPTADNEWVVAGPHVMMVVPDPAQLDAVTTDPSGGGPWVMWKGTPYAHVMMPTAR